MSKVAVLKGFNDHFAEFLGALQVVFPENDDLAARALSSFRQMPARQDIQIEPPNQ